MHIFVMQNVSRKKNHKKLLTVALKLLVKIQSFTPHMQGNQGKLEIKV